MFNEKMEEMHCRYRFSYYILRERKGRYYVCKLEYIEGDAKGNCVWPLAEVVETYEKVKEDNSGYVRRYSPIYGPAGI